MSPDFLIRPAETGDVTQLVKLVGELGYEVSPGHLLACLLAGSSGDTDQVLVAAGDAQVLGCISLHTLPLFHRDGKLGRITSLVVGASQRGHGIGSAMLLAAHAWFRASGCMKFEVTSGDRREAAHRFYQRHGYARDGQRLSRPDIV